MKISGVSRLKKKLRRLPKAARDEIRVAIGKGADEIVAMMKSLVPVGDSGALKASIGWTWGAPPKGSLGLARTSEVAGAAGLVATIYAGGGEAFYARFVEYGTKKHINGGLFAGSKHPGTTAQPFFYPSYRLGKKRARARVTRAATKAAKKVAAGG